jgi:hypothetical protein
MANRRDRNPRILMIVGFAALAASGIFLRLHQDFLAGAGLGAGVASIAVWLFRRNRT